MSEKFNCPCWFSPILLMYMSHFSFCHFFFFNKSFFLSFSWNAHLCFTNCRFLPLIAHSLPVFLHMKNYGNNLVFKERKGLMLLRTAAGKTGKFLHSSLQSFLNLHTHFYCYSWAGQSLILNIWMDESERGLIQLFYPSKMGYLSTHS